MTETDLSEARSLTPSGRAGSLPDGTLVALDCGVPAAEFDALESAALCCDRPWRSMLELRGADRVRFLNGLMTCDVKGLADGGGVYGFFTGAKGRIVADGVVVARPEALWIDVPVAVADAVAEHLRKYVISDRVEVSRPALRSFLVAGPRAVETWQEVAGASPPETPWSGVEGSVAGATVWAVDERRVGVPALALWVEDEVAPTVFEAFGDTSAVGGFAAIDAARIAAGIPWFGIDFGVSTAGATAEGSIAEGASHIPQETSLTTSAVSFDKGCYLGQEVVARVHFLGRASRSLKRLRFAVGSAAEPGATLRAGDRDAGEVTSVARHDGALVGLGFVQQRVDDEGLELSDASGLPVAVSTIPTI